ncbi:MAG: hypothetical protein H6746_07190 [Deltaproteobacteria bacterium]|nr:hypothetical protein [Deltaproteobacteria bacterium]
MSAGRAMRAIHRVFIALCWTALGALALGWTLQAACALPPSPGAGRFAGLVFAHRAQSGGGTPENTLAAIRAAARAGVRAVELDVRLTADGQAVILHDETVDRTTEGYGRVDALTLAEARALDACGALAGCSGERIPTLDEAVALASELGLAVELDVKDVDRAAVSEAIAATLARHDAFGHVFASSFYPQVLYALRSREPRLVTALAIRPDATGVALVDRVLMSFWLPHWLGVGLIEPHRDLVSAERVAAWRQRGFLVNAWTVNDGAEKAWFRHLGIAFTTNCPGTSCPDDSSDSM